MFAHQPGDVLQVLPHNIISAEEQTWIERVFRCSFDDVLHLRKCRTHNDDDDDDNNDDNPFPALCSVRELFCQWLDVHGTPSRYFFEQLAQFARLNAISTSDGFSTFELDTATTTERTKVMELSDIDHHSEFERYCVKEKRTYLEVMQDFAHCAPPSLAHIIECVPQTRPREYSIASALSASPSCIQLLIALLDFKTPMGRSRKGVCSEYIASLPQQHQQPIFLPCAVKRGGVFSSAAAAAVVSSTPALFIATGTGIAPFRSIVQARAVAR
jgi:sulfite reductase alpha subunit-like flavoprotein